MVEPHEKENKVIVRVDTDAGIYGLGEVDDFMGVREALAYMKQYFMGRDALLKQKQDGLKRKLVGFEMVERGIARDHYPVVLDGHTVGRVTSGSPAPFLKKNIGLTYLPADRTAVGTEFTVLIRDAPVKARVVPTPFYKRVKTAGM